MTDRNRPLLAVLIDAENVSHKDAEPILKEVAAIGEPALRRVYADWSQDGRNSWKEKSLSLGLVARQVTSSSRGKNASDIGLVIDAMDILHSERFDGFVLVSSDGDFTSLANRLREEGRLVIGIGERKTPEPLRKVCNRFIFIENIVAMSDDEKQASSGTVPKKAEVVRLIRQAMDQIDQDEDWYRLGTLGSTIRNTQPDFDPRTYGHAKLSQLVLALPEVETKLDGTVWHARLKPKPVRRKKSG